MNQSLRPNLFLIVLLVLVAAMPVSSQTEVKRDTINMAPLTLKLIKARQYQQSVQMVFELQNRIDWLKHCWIGISFYDKEGEFLYRELPLMYTSIPNGRNQRQEIWLESTDIEEIGTLLFRPILLETSLREYVFDSRQIDIIIEPPHYYSVTFEGEP